MKAGRQENRMGPVTVLLQHSLWAPTTYKVLYWALTQREGKDLAPGSLASSWEDKHGSEDGKETSKSIVKHLETYRILTPFSRWCGFFQSFRTGRMRTNTKDSEDAVQHRCKWITTRGKQTTRRTTAGQQHRISTKKRSAMLGKRNGCEWYRNTAKKYWQ